MFIGLDIGSSSVKVSCFDGIDFHIVRKNYPSETDRREQDLTVVMKTISLACRELLSIVPGKSITGISLSGHGPSILFLDPKGEVASSLVTWQDNRATREAEQLSRTIPGFSKDGSSYEAKLLWFYHHHPEFFDPGYTALYPKDYVLFALCGQRLIDSSTASTLTFFDRRACKWDQQAVPFPISVLPQVADSWQEVGCTGTTFSRDCGFADGIALYPGGIDAYCGVVGSGSISPSILIEETGTSTCISRCSPFGEGKDWHVLPNLSLTMKTISATGLSFQWFMDLFSLSSLKDLQAELGPARPIPLLFLPYLIGERSPIWDDKALGAFIGIRPDTSSASLLGGIMQGTAFAIRQNIELLAGLDASSIAVNAVGGSAKDSAWLQMKADITGLPYRRMRVTDGAAVGAALIASVGSGELSLFDIPSVITVEKEFLPDFTYRSRYLELYEGYTALYGTLKPMFPMLHADNIRGNM
ncbi:MAG: FGGY-family carbohydrate kinase [Sphaerochaeta sp.]|nr:FGGY-family carbohydrate kinase [Sphaerochaeta sp.]